jgi:hypothetical protein
LMEDPKINVILPTVLPNGNAPAVFKVDYMCSRLKKKNTGTLVTSVFIGGWRRYSIRGIVRRKY